MATMGVKIGTKTWDDRPRDPVVKNDQPQTIGADARQKEFGGDDLGAILNKISDPNYVDPSKRMRTVGNSKMDKDAFMKMMLAQMKNQDPTNPLKSHEMAAQMAQFTSVEQMVNMNKTLEEMKDGQKPMETYQALQYLGKAVAGDSAKVVRLKNDKDHAFTFDLPADSSSVTIKVKNGAGDVIRTSEIKNMKKGARSWTWNGQNDIGSVQPVGEYTFAIEAKDPQGRKLAVKTDFEGIISGVSHTAEGPVLMVGAQTVKLRDVKKIVDPALVNAKKPTPAQQNDQKIDQKSAQALQKNQGAYEIEKSGGNIMTDVGMSREMLEKVGREMSGPPQGATAEAPKVAEASKEPSGKGI